MKIAIGTDHAGFRLKEVLKSYLTAKEHHVTDFGTDSDSPVDYPDYIRPAAESVASGECDLGIVLGGSGNGEAIVANKVRGIRCAVSMGARMISEELAKLICNAWLSAEFQGGRHQARIDKISRMESFNSHKQ